MEEGKTGNFEKLPINSFSEVVVAKPQVGCTEEEILEVLNDLSLAVDAKDYVIQTPTKENPSLSDDYIFDTNDENLILKDLSVENHVAKIKDLSKGALRRKCEGLPQEYLHVFQYSCNLKRRDAQESGISSEDISFILRLMTERYRTKKFLLFPFIRTRNKVNKSKQKKSK